jgi:hypothetical protein
MISAGVVEVALEYLDHCEAQRTLPTLTGLLHHVDAYDRCIPSRDEVNAALSQRPALRVRRESDAVVFSGDGPDQLVTDRDMSIAHSQYREAFAVAHHKASQ